jgi:hypothetical protein
MDSSYNEIPLLFRPDVLITSSTRTTHFVRFLLFYRSGLPNNDGSLRFNEGGKERRLNRSKFVVRNVNVGGIP